MSRSIDPPGASSPRFIRLAEPAARFAVEQAVRARAAGRGISKLIYRLAKQDHIS